MNVDGFPTTKGSFLVDPLMAPTIEPPPVQRDFGVSLVP
jgi:hypothetical protein